MPGKIKREMQLPVLHPDAAGVAIGVRRFADLDAAAEGLFSCV
jgi:hypothetical protein